MNLFDGAPVEWPDRGRFFDENFVAFVACLSLDDELLRGLASTVALKVLHAQTTQTMSNGSGVVTKNFYTRFWRSTSVVLMTVSEKLLSLQHQEKSTIIFVRDYIETRLKLVQQHQVRKLPIL